MEFKITMRCSITDPKERANRLSRVFRHFEEKKAATTGEVVEAAPVVTAKETQAFQPESNDILLPGQLKNQSINY